MAARLGALIRAAESCGISCERPSSGSHWKFKAEGARTYPVPAPNGDRSEIDSVYLKGFCRNFGDRLKRRFEIPDGEPKEIAKQVLKAFCALL